MKVGKEAVDDLEPEARVYEKVAPSTSSGNPVRGFADLVFQGPCGGSSYRHELFSCLFPFIDERGGVLRHFIVLWFQGMVFDFHAPNRLECPITYVKQDLTSTDTSFLKPRENLACEMQPRRWRCNGSFVPGINCLVSLPVRFQGIAPGTMNVGRQRRLPNSVQIRKERLRRVKLKNPLPGFQNLYDLSFDIGDFQELACGGLVSRLQKGGPLAGGALPDEKDFYSLPLAWTVSPKPGREYAGVIQNQKVFRGQYFWQFAEEAMRPLAALPPDDHHARFVAAGERTLGYEFCGQRKFEVGELHTN